MVYAFGVVYGEWAGEKRGLTTADGVGVMEVKAKDWAGRKKVPCPICSVWVLDRAGFDSLVLIEMG